MKITIYTILLLIACPGCSHTNSSRQLEQVMLDPVRMYDHVEYGKLYYNLHAESSKVYLRIVNASGPAVFAKVRSLRIAHCAVSGPDGSYISGGGDLGLFTIKGSIEYLRLAYDLHEDGSICGWQITPCGSIDLKMLDPDNFFEFDTNIDYFIELNANIDCFMRDSSGNYRDTTLIVKHKSRLSEIDGIQQGNTVERAEARP